MTTQPELSIIIPAYNEAARIAPTLEALSACLSQDGPRFELLVVDDGSTDATAQVVREIAARIPEVLYLDAGPNRGKGSAVRIGMLAARGAIRVMYDADGSIPPHQLPRVINPVALGKADIAIGSRYAEGAAVDRAQPRYRVVWSRACNAVIRRTLLPGIRDTQCGCKAFSAAAAQAIFPRGTIDRWSFDLEILALALREGYAITEVGVAWSNASGSRVHPLRDATRAIREYWRIYRNLTSPRHAGRATARAPSLRPTHT